MLGFGPISSSAICALSDSLTIRLSGEFAGEVTWEAAPYSQYRALLTSGARIVYTIEFDMRAVR